MRYIFVILTLVCLLLLVPGATRAQQPSTPQIQTALTMVLDWHSSPTHTTSPLFNLGMKKPSFTLRWLCGVNQSFTLDMWAKSGVPIIFNLRPTCDGAWHQLVVQWQSGAPDREYITISPAYAHIEVLH